MLACAKAAVEFCLAFLFRRPTQCVGAAFAVATWLSVCVCVCHVDELYPNVLVDRQATFTGL